MNLALCVSNYRSWQPVYPTVKEFSVDIRFKFGGYFVPGTNQKVHDAMNELICIGICGPSVRIVKTFHFCDSCESFI
ncbi:MAG TPA: hypothetical protein VFY55_06190, partial [Nitrososphaeraceae archaeon]|nr:hypothetical protein [Nitrososphaeraceae archaeon]